MSKQKKPKSCMYPCPGDCGETARFVPGKAALSAVKEEGIEGYDLVYLADAQHKNVFLFKKFIFIYKIDIKYLSFLVF